MESLSIEHSRDLAEGQAFFTQLPDARQQTLALRHLPVTEDRPNQVVLARAAAQPLHGDLHSVCVFLQSDHDPLDEEADDLLPVGWRRSRRLP
jgi:hypothetical protein